MQRLIGRGCVAAGRATASASCTRTPGPGEGSGYSRIGWHSDAQSGPNLDWWPSVAFTIHLDATSPQNGFLRVVPGSHLGGTDGIPLGFEKVPGEVAAYCDRGDVLLHHSDLWHSAARATDDGPGGIRRHIRGGWYGGTRPADEARPHRLRKERPPLISRTHTPAPSPVAIGHSCARAYPLGAFNGT